MVTGSSTAGSSSTRDYLLKFLQQKVNSFIKWDLVRFFHDNPHTKDTAESIARYTGREARNIKHELDGLVEAGVLQAEDISEFRVYALIDDAEVRQVIHAFIEACHDRQFRVEAINCVIREMKFSPRHDF